MARTLHNAGFELVLWNRSAPKAHALGEELGAAVLSTAAEASSRAQVVLSSLADDAALEAVYLSSDGVVAGLHRDVVAVDTSTVDPVTVRKVGRAVDDVGAQFLDSPVSGSVTTVEAGALTVMVGGDEAALERARPALEALASRIVHTGDRGTGAVTKLAVNALVHGLNIALSEALVLAERGGVDRATAYEVFANGAGGAPFVQYKRDSFLHPESSVVAFTLDLVAKDLELITGLATRVGAPMNQARAGSRIVDEAIGAGLGSRDLSAVAAYLRGSVV